MPLRGTCFTVRMYLIACRYFQTNCYSVKIALLVKALLVKALLSLQ